MWKVGKFEKNAKLKKKKIKNLTNLKTNKKKTGNVEIFYR